MSGARSVLAGLLIVSLVLTLVPSSIAAPVGLQTLGTALSGTHRIDLAPLPGSGAMLVSALGYSSVQFYEVDEDGSAPAIALASFALASTADLAPLSGARLVALSPERAMLAYARNGEVRVTVVNPFTGEWILDSRASQTNEFAISPTLALSADGPTLSYLTLGAPGRTVVVAKLALDGAVLSSESMLLGDGYSATLIASAPTLRVGVLRPSGVSLYTVGQGAPSPVGSVSVSAVAGSLWARDGQLRGLLSTSTGLVRVQAPLDSPSTASFAAISGGANALEVFAVDSGDGRLAASVRGAASSLLVREDGIGSYSVSTLSGLRAAGAACDAFGLARAVIAGNSLSLDTFTAGDFDAVASSLAGPAVMEAASSASFTVSVRAVRSAITVVGLSFDGPAGWSASTSSYSVPLSKGEGVQLSFSLFVPAGAAAGSYAVSVRPAVVEASYAPWATATVTVPNGATVTPTAAGGLVDLSPGGATTVTIGLTNRGATAVVSSVSVSAPSGFIISPPVTSVALAPGSTAQVSFQVSVSQGTLPVEDGTISLRVQPTDGSASTDLLLPARIRGVFLPQLLSTPRDISGSPGESVAAPFSVLNTGNMGGIVVLSASLTGLPGSALSGVPDTVFVPAFTRVDLPVRVLVPSTAAAATPFEVALSATRASDGSAVGPALSLLGTVRPSLSFAASFATGPAVLPGAEAQGTLTLSNSGNAAITIDLSFAGVEPGFALRAESGATTGLRLPPGTTLEVPLSYQASATAAPGPRVFQVTATPSAGSGRTVEVPFEVLATHALSLAVKAPPTLSLPDAPSATLDFEVENGGNSDVGVLLSFSSPLGSLAAVEGATLLPVASPGSPQTIPAFSTVAFRATVAPGFLSGETQSVVRVTAESAAGDTAIATATFERLRSDAAVLTLSARPVSGPAEAGELHQVVADIGNAGPGTAVRLEAILSADGVVVGRVTVDALAPGPARLVQFFFVPRAANTELTLTLVSRLSGLDRDGSNNAASVTLTVAAPEASGASAIPPAVPVAAGSLSLFALAGLALTEIGKSTLISVLFLPLYVKLRPEEVLDQYLRGQIHGFIIANPGEHYNAIKDQLGVTNGALAYHLRVLERAGLIRPVRDGMYKRFYPMGVKVSRKRRLSPFQIAIVKVVRDHPDVSQKHIAELLGVSNQVVNYNVKQLEEGGVLKVDRTERASKVTLGPEAPAPEGVPLLSPAPQQAPP